MWRLFQFVVPARTIHPSMGEPSSRRPLGIPVLWDGENPLARRSHPLWFVPNNPVEVGPQAQSNTAQVLHTVCA